MVCVPFYVFTYIHTCPLVDPRVARHARSFTHALCSLLIVREGKDDQFFFFSFSDFFCIFFISKSIDKLGKSHRLIAVSTFHIYIYIKNATAVFRSNRFFLNLSDSRQYLIRVLIDARFTYDVYLRSKNQWDPIARRFTVARNVAFSNDDWFFLRNYRRALEGGVYIIRRFVAHNCTRSF